MDMQFGFPAVAAESIELSAAPARLVEQRDRVFALIREFQRTVARPRGLYDAIRILQEILPCSGAYFATVESPHRDEHRRLLEGLKQTLDRCSGSRAKPTATELAHALDALVLHEAVIRLPKSYFLFAPTRPRKSRDAA
jgi:hypothetical protein